MNETPFDYQAAYVSLRESVLAALATPHAQHYTHSYMRRLLDVALNDATYAGVREPEKRARDTSIS